MDVPSPLARMILMPALPAFHARYPDIQLDMGVSDRMVDLIGDNVDCVVRGGELTDQSLMARRVGDLQLGRLRGAELSGAPARPRTRGSWKTRITASSASYARAAAPWHPSPCDPSASASRCKAATCVAVDDGNAYLAAGLAGLGVLWLPHYMADAHVARGELVPLFEDWRLDPMPLYVAFPPNRHVSTKLRVFIDWVVELMAQHAPIAKTRRTR